MMPSAASVVVPRGIGPASTGRTLTGTMADARGGWCRASLPRITTRIPGGDDEHAR